MQYKKSIKIIIDKRKLDTLIRLNCPKENIFSLILDNKLILTNDNLIDDNLETLLEVKEFNNWGGFRLGSGRHKKNQLENQLENQVDNQDINQVVDKDKDIDIDIDIDNLTNSISNSIDNNLTNSIVNITRENKKNKFGEFKNVLLTDEQYKKLNDIYGEHVSMAIEKLSAYIESSGHKYKNHYAVLGKHNWVYKQMKKEEEEKRKGSFY